ncbi:MAG: hypothetical protein LAN83_19790 [Acidobacteriia bacterium]|nr:hypothetical protein [Terriglobia bacterium]
MKSPDLDEIQRRFVAMPPEEFALLKRGDLTESGRELYDREIERRSSPEWSALQARKEAEYVKRLEGYTSKYHCPQCQEKLKRGEYARWVKWFIGPIFGRLLRPLICKQHGEIDIELLAAEEQRSAKTARFIGLVVGGILNVILFVFLLWYSFFSEL